MSEGWTLFRSVGAKDGSIPPPQGKNEPIHPPRHTTQELEKVLHKIGLRALLTCCTCILELQVVHKNGH